MENIRFTQAGLIKTVAVRFVGAILVLALLFFLPAGTFAYWEAWTYLVILFVPLLFVLFYLLKNSPELLERRMRMKEKESEQKLIIRPFLPFLLAFVLPGLDIRFGWSKVPAGLVLFADLVVLLGYGIVFWVFRTNRYASRVIEVEQGQTVINSGPYALVRHPMYIGALLLYCLSPLALGSYWAMIPGILIIPVIVARILNEEKVLARDLKGYREYLQKTKYRLIPGIW